MQERSSWHLASERQTETATSPPPRNPLTPPPRIESKSNNVSNLNGKQAPTPPNTPPQRTVNAASAKSTVRLRFGGDARPKKPSKLIHAAENALNAPLQTLHREVSRNERDNAGVEAGHRLEEAGEFGLRTLRHVQRQHRERTIRKREKTARMNTGRSRACDSLGPGDATSAGSVSRRYQRKAIRNEYMAAQAGRASPGTAASSSVANAAGAMGRTGSGAIGAGAGGAATDSLRNRAMQSLSNIAKGAGERLLAFLAANKKVFLIAMGIGVAILLLLNLLASCSQLALGTANAILATSFTADEAAIRDAELEMTRLEVELEYGVMNTESSQRGYDEYRYAIDPIGHEPFELIAYLTARYGDFTAEQATQEVRSLYQAMYTLTRRADAETRYRTESRPYVEFVTDPVTGAITISTGTRDVQVSYTYNILQTSLVSRSLYAVVFPRMTAEGREMYFVYLETQGNHARFGSPFASDWHGQVASMFGWRVHPITHALQNHRGLDLSAPTGTLILAIHDGRVVTVGLDTGGFGNYVVIEDVTGVRITYAHCETIAVRQGQSVTKGMPIATVGNTGTSTGSHLHLELREAGEYLNPYFLLEGAGPIRSGSGGSTGTVLDYEVLPEALTDPVFAALIREAEKYLGYPYVWGGSTPATSFDCSGFVCWVFQASSVYPLSRTTAQDIYNQCVPVSPANARPGDLVFFSGTYDSDGPVSHVAIYVGDGMMIHAGKPIQYASMQTTYWQSHFYAFGRLPARR